MTVKKSLCSAAVLILSITLASAQDGKTDFTQTPSGSDPAETLVPLLMRERMQQQRYGPNHPSVVALQQQIQLTTKFLRDKAEAHERELSKLVKRDLIQLVRQRDELENEHQTLRAELWDRRVEVEPQTSDALKLMSQQIAEAQIKYRLQELEARALIQIAEDDARNGGVSPRMKVQEEKKNLAKQILSESLEQMDRLEAMAKKGIVGASELGKARQAVQEAKVRLLEVEVESVENEVDDLQEAAMKLKLSQVMQELLKAEALKLSSRRQKADGLEAEESRLDMLRRRKNQVEERITSLNMTPTSEVWLDLHGLLPLLPKPPEESAGEESAKPTPKIDE